ncbi:MAG TPA: PD-(D/E)XK motif protein, partial [Myxococcota bacterium]|nr:PD-(D/E)XK motif protein [Myxococcota bacterium]
MKSIDGPSAELWGDLRESPAQAVGQFTAQEIRADGLRTGLFMAIGHDQSLHLFLPLEAAEDPDLPLRLTGIEVAERQVMLVDGSPRLYLDISSTVAYESMFTTVGREVAQAVAVEGREARKAALATIRRWQTFWKRPRGAELNRAEQLGLFGEVWLLGQLIRSLGPGVVERWTGPNGERHDFQGPGTHLEVKVTEKESPVFRISGLDQLQAPEGRILCLVAIMVREE